MMASQSPGLTILFVSSLADPKKGGGVEHTLMNLTKALTDRGHRCILLSLGNSSGLSKAEVDGVTLWMAGATAGVWPWAEAECGERPGLLKRQTSHALTTFNPFIQDSLRKIIQIEKPDIISFHNLTGWSVASWKTASMLGVPTLQVLHDFLPICFHSVMTRGLERCEAPCRYCKFRRCTTRPYSKYLTAVVGVSHYVLGRYLELGYFNATPVRKVIHNVRLAAQLGVGEHPVLERSGPIRFGYIGRLDPFKGVEQLIRAFRDGNIPGAELFVAGSGSSSYESHLRHISDGQVRFLGQVRPADFFPAVDVIVVPSIWNEVLGNVVYEALAFGKVVLASNRGGIPEMIENGVNGLLFNPEDHGSFVKYLKKLAIDTSLRKRLSEAAPESASEFLDGDLWVRRYEQVYQDMMTSNKRRTEE